MNRIFRFVSAVRRFTQMKPRSACLGRHTEDTKTDYFAADEHKERKGILI